MLDVCIDTKKPFLTTSDGGMFQRLCQGEKSFAVDVHLLKGQVVAYDSAIRSKDPYNFPDTSLGCDPHDDSTESISVRIFGNGDAFKQTTAILSDERTMIWNRGIYLIHRDESHGCGGGYTSQSIVLPTGKEMEFSSLSLPYPKSIPVATLIYTAESSTLTLGGVHPGDIETKTVYTGSISIKDSTASIGAKLTQFSRQFSHVPATYILSFVEYPHIYFQYRTSVPQSEQMVKLSPDVIKTLDKNGFLNDFEATRNLMADYEIEHGTNRGLASKDAMGKLFTWKDIKADMLPIFRFVPFDTEGNYLLYPTEKYTFTVFAEMCKPAIYAYDSDTSINKTVQVSLPPSGVFTKLIPNFSFGTTWRFGTNASGTIRPASESFSVGTYAQYAPVYPFENFGWSANDTEPEATPDVFPYLYYSARVTNYTYNTNGWQVRGKDISNFFATTLPKIGFDTREMNEFTEYWLPEFSNDINYFVSFKYANDLAQYAALHFDPEPNATFRVFLEAYPIAAINPNFAWPEVGNTFDNILIQSFVRSGKYDVFEWGGTLARADGTTLIH